MEKRHVVYLVCEAYDCELPVGVFDTLESCALFLGLSFPAVSLAIKRCSVVCGAFRVYRLWLG